jgi:hypothetical protein
MLSLSFSRRQALVALGSTLLLQRSAMAQTAAPSIIVHKNPSCGCCTAWADHLRNNGFTVSVVETTEMNAVKAAAGVPKDLASCHTARIDAYVVEGHVPADAIRRLLHEKPDAIGLAVPGMPAGSPGMNGEAEAFDVIMFKGETRSVFGRYQADKPL